MALEVNQKNNPDLYMFDQEPEIVTDTEVPTSDIKVQNERVFDGASQDSEASNLSAQSGHVSNQAKLGGESLDTTMEQIISAVVNKLSTSLQALCVSDRVVEAQQSAQDWKELCKLMIANPEVINDKLSVNQHPNNIYRRIGADISDPSKEYFKRFWQVQY